MGSKIDYCNSLYYGITNKQIHPFQGVQNTLCHLHLWSNVTGALKSLKRLPVKSRVQFIICLITYKVDKTNYPAYLEDCLWAPSKDHGFDYPNDLCIKNSFLRRLDATEVLQIRLYKSVGHIDLRAHSPE